MAEDTVRLFSHTSLTQQTGQQGPETVFISAEEVKSYICEISFFSPFFGKVQHNLDTNYCQQKLSNPFFILFFFICLYLKFLLYVTFFRNKIRSQTCLFRDELSVCH